MREAGQRRRIGDQRRRETSMPRVIAAEQTRRESDLRRPVDAARAAPAEYLADKLLAQAAGEFEFGILYVAANKVVDPILRQIVRRGVAGERLPEPAHVLLDAVLDDDPDFAQIVFDDVVGIEGHTEVPDVIFVEI